MAEIDSADIGDEVLVDLQEAPKGPDPAMWGEEHAAAFDAAGVDAPQLVQLGPGEKGPSAEQWGEEHAAMAIAHPDDA